MKAEDFAAVLKTSLTDLHGISEATVQDIATEFGPRLANLVTSDDPTGERDDIMLNAKIALADRGVQVETNIGRTIVKVIETAANVGFTMAKIAGKAAAA